MKGPKLLIWGLVVVILVAAGIAVTRPASATTKAVGNAELRGLQAAGATVVDVRTAGEYTSGHIPGAINVPLDVLTQQAESWDRSHAIVVYCATGARSANASGWLAANGFKKVYDLTAGIAAWDGTLDRTAPSGAAAAALKPKATATPVVIEFYSDT